MRDWEMISHAMNDFIAQDDRVAVIGRAIWRHKRTGKVADTRKVDIWRFRDGKAVDFGSSTIPPGSSRRDAVNILLTRSW